MDIMVWAALTRAGAPLQKLQVQKKDIQQTTMGITVQAHMLARTLENSFDKSTRIGGTSTGSMFGIYLRPQIDV